MTDGRRKNDHGIALWASLVAFFGSLGSFTLIDAITPDDLRNGVAALLTALIVAGGVYARERLKQAQRESRRRNIKHGGSRGEPDRDPPPTDPPMAA